MYFEGEVRTGDGVPPAGALDGNYPNPFNPETRIRYGIPADIATGTPVRLEIYGIDGRRVRSFTVDRTPGWHEVTWDGTDDRGVVQVDRHVRDAVRGGNQGRDRQDDDAEVGCRVGDDPQGEGPGPARPGPCFPRQREIGYAGGGGYPS